MTKTLPKYIELKNKIIKDIESGILNINDKLLSRNEMVKIYAYSDTTIKNAINELENEGYIYTIKGKGTFVAQRKTDNKTMAVIVPFLTDLNGMFSSEEGRLVHVYPFLVQNIESIAHEKNWRVQLYLYYTDYNKERQILSGLLKGDADCAIYIHHTNKNNIDILQKLADEDFPITAVDIYPKEIQNISRVTTDNVNGVYDMTTQLIKHGFERIVCITWHVYHSSTIDREKGYKKAMAENHLPWELIELNDQAANLNQSGIDNINQYLPRIFSSEIKTAIISIMPFQHLLIWKAVNKAGLDPSKIGWGCCDSPNIAYPSNVSHIEMLQDFNAIAKEAIKSVESMMENNSQEKPIIEINYHLNNNL